MSIIAESFTVPANEGELARIARIAMLRRTLAPDIRVSTGASSRVGAQTPSDVVGRDGVLALVSRWSPPPGGVVVDFVDMNVTLDDSGATAQVYCTAKITSGTEQPLVDARELRIALSKIDGMWLVTSVRPEDTLRR